jgi:hypothetical protein
MVELHCIIRIKKKTTSLITHKKDFLITAEWHFFSARHGKCPDDALGGITKWKTARMSLRCPHDKQILTPKDSCEFTQ